MHLDSSKPLNPVGDERGMALIVALMSMMLLSALGLGLVMTTMSETLITAHYRDSGEAMYAADAGVERVMQELLTVPDWNRILTGNVQSSLIDGPPTGTRTMPDGSTIDLSAVTNMLNCAKTTACSTSDMDTWTMDRPFGVNNPRWNLFAYAPLTRIIETGTVPSSMYILVWVADDIAENDNNPAADGILEGNRGRGVLMLRAEAFGPQGARSAIEVTVARTDTTQLERGYTGQRGQDEQNRRARKAAVQTPGKALTRSTLNVSGNTSGFTIQ